MINQFSLLCSLSTKIVLLVLVACPSYHRRGEGESVVRGDPVSGNPRPPPYLANHAKVTSTKLAQEAKETVIAVRKILSIQGLPSPMIVAADSVMISSLRTTSWMGRTAN